MCILFSSNSFVFANQDPQPIGNGGEIRDPLPVGNSSINVNNPNSDPTAKIKLVNPLKSTKTLPELIEGILRIVLTIGIPVVALAIIYAGFRFVVAQGKPQELETARRNLLYVLIGAGILLGAYVIAEALVGTIKAIRS